MVPLFLRLNIIPSSIAAKLRRVDWIGSAIFVASMTSFLIPLTWGGVMYDWTSWRTLVPLILGAVGILGFCLYEKYLAPEPAIRLSIFRNATTNIAFFTTTLHGLILWCLLYYQPLYYEAVKGYSPIIAGVSLFPATFTVAPMAVVTGITITKTNSYRWTIWVGWLFGTLGLGLTILLDVGTSIPQFIFINLVPGIGLGILFPALQFQLQAASTNKDMAFAVAMFTFFRSFGQALGVAIGGVIFQNQMIKKLQAYPHYAAQASELAKDAAALVEIIKKTPAAIDKLDLRTAYTDSIRTVYIVLTALASVALVTCFFIKAYDINVALETDQGLIEKKKESNTVLEEAK
jgi:Fungal trichothecene efflux pump (TRI12)